ncbi:MAG: hypothetical protein NWE76_09960 [Candidatus Bathyarchaeota archaeon]|nr:hypothetical protein [Candidatus Bathyarchaeota archaeon]
MSFLSLAIITVLGLLLAVSLYYAVKFALIILRVEDAIEESLDVIDEKYRSMSKVLEIPLFYDSPQIRQVVNDIKATRETLLLIANKFAAIDPGSQSSQDANLDGKDKEN